MRVAQGSKIQRRGQGAGWLAVMSAVAVLAGCGRAPEPVPVASTHQGPVQMSAAASAPAMVEQVRPKSAAASPFELMGTSINETHSFAVLKQSGDRVFTVREGDKVEGYTIAAIEPDRIRLTSPENAEQLLVAANKPASLRVSEAANPAAAPARPGLITQGINTDQSISANAVTGPTGFDPNNGRQMGH
jgi:hypothetical protein